MFLKILLLFLSLFTCGYAVTLLYLNISDFFKRFSLSFIIGVSLTVIVSTTLSLINPLYIKHTFFVLVFISLTLLIILHQKEEKSNFFTIFHEWKNLSIKQKTLTFIFVLLSFLASIIFVFYPHFYPNLYPYPIHADEWWQVASTQNVINGRGINVNPYAFYKEINYKPGFTAFMGAIFGFLNTDPIRGWIFLPTLNYFFIALSLAFLIYSKTENVYSSLFAILLPASLSSNVHMLGWWFFVPFIFSFIFFVPFFVCSNELLQQDKKSLIIGFLIMVALGLVYAPFLGLFLLFVFPLLSKKIISNAKLLFITLLLFVLFLTLALKFSPYPQLWTNDYQIKNNNQFAKTFIKSFFVPQNAVPAHSAYLNIFTTIPPLLLALSMVGIIFILLSKTNLKFLLIAWVGGLMLTIFFYFSKLSFLTLFEREFYLFGFTVSTLGALGAGMLTSILKHKLWKVAIFTLIFLFLFGGYITKHKIADANLYYLVDQKNLLAMHWLKNQTDLNKYYVFADPPVASILTPLTGNPVKINWLSVKTPQSEKIPFSIREFTLLDCPQKMWVLKNLETQIVYSDEEQNCSFFKELYKKDGIYIYLAQW